MIGDIFAKAGRFAVRRTLPKLIANESIDFVVANGENIAGGIGITPELAKDLFDFGVDVITSGNHIWRQREIRAYIEKNNRLLRPYNYIKSQPGNGFGIFETPAGVKVAVINLAGQIFMDVHPDNPFTAADEAVKLTKDADIRVVDFHAEATSEKIAMGYYLDGRVSAVVGTHTHVQTSDDQILENGTAYMTDAGMTGPHNSVIGMRKDIVVSRFATGMPESFKPAKNDPRFQGVIIDFEGSKAVSIKRVDISVPLG